MSSIKPTIGRKVYFWQSGLSCVKDDKQAFDATIIYVQNDTTVDVMFTNHYGTTSSAVGMQLRDPGANRHGDGENYVTWMPYQVGQAKQEASKTTPAQP